MIKLLAETPGDQKIIDNLQRSLDQLRKHMEERIREFIEENRKLKDELNEYKKRHPSNIGVKNGKTYDIAVSGDAHPENIIPEMQEKRKPGAQPGHKGHFRIRSRPDRKIRIHLDLHECPECHSHLKRKGSMKRIIENIPIIKPDITEYRMDRLYCSRCHRIYEPRIPEAFPGATLSLRAMLTVAYFRIGMSIEHVSSTMLNVFGIHISEGGIQNILSQLSDSLWDEYSSLLQAIRNAPSRHMDSTSWRIDGNPYNLWTFLTESEAIFLVRKGNGHEVPMYMTGIPLSKHWHPRRTMISSTAGPTSYAMQRSLRISTAMRVEG